ncbi:hypothetical protein C8Q77DRAFT_1207436 [Trametes polyzona]|nr:hypothetical protein C8Q77DRAFT_1207436 [Trametes polyzona]
MIAPIPTSFLALPQQAELRQLWSPPPKSQSRSQLRSPPPKPSAARSDLSPSSSTESFLRPAMQRLPRVQPRRRERREKTDFETPMERRVGFQMKLLSLRDAQKRNSIVYGSGIVLVNLNFNLKVLARVAEDLDWTTPHWTRAWVSPAGINSRRRTTDAALIQDPGPRTSVGGVGRGIGCPDDAGPVGTQRKATAFTSVERRGS